ncbi:MAG: chemotaxis protein CheX [Thiobacillus sp.]|nr:chemotaxis protein CheX [Thiobacillus sp.]
MNAQAHPYASLKPDDLNVFVEAIAHYFHQISAEDAQVRPAYLTDEDDRRRGDYTGLIRISGQFQGQVYFSAPSAMLRHLLLSQGESQHSEDTLLDLVGEVANTLSGNARRYFGDRFVISVPQTQRGAPAATGEHAFAIPLNWKKYNALLIVEVDRCGA